MSVYLKHFGLKKEPFSIVPDSKFLYPSYRHRQAVAHLKYGLDREGGFIVLTGEVGTGKTTLTKTLIEHLPPNVRVGYILNSKLKESDLFASICKELSIRFRKNSNLSFSKQCTDAIYDDLLETHSQGLKTLIVIEEAQNLDDEILESLRLLSNLETSSNKLLHILLVGQPELIRKLEQNNLRQLNQRVVSRFHLLPLQNNEVKDYITYRLKQGGTNRELFGNRACKQIYRLTKGVPRLINLICHQALLGMYSENKHTASTELIREACKEALGAQITGTTNKWLVNLSLLLASLIVLVIATKEKHELSFDSFINEESQNILEVDTADNEAINQSLDSEKNENKSINPSNSSVKSNPLKSLFLIWGFEVGDAFTNEEFENLASRFGLKLENETNILFKTIENLNRPGVVHLMDENSILSSSLLVEIGEESVVLMNGKSTNEMELDVFIQNWTGSFNYLWKPEPNFTSLQLGDENQEGLSWLQDQLFKINNEREFLITGGRFTKAVYNEVIELQKKNNIEQDGIVGQQTLMLINQLTNTAIPTLAKESYR